jgi:hypothetical protein
VPESEEVHGFFIDLTASVGTFPRGRRMCETMVFWETAHKVAGMPQLMLDFART